jgi:hypothetical protein
MVNGMAIRETSELGGEGVAVCPESLDHNPTLPLYWSEHLRNKAFKGRFHSFIFVGQL